MAALRCCWKAASRLSRRRAGSGSFFFHDDNLSDIPSIKLLIHVAIARYQAMRGKMENLVRVLDDLRHTVGLAMGPDVANQMAKAAETVKDIANV